MRARRCAPHVPCAISVASALHRPFDLSPGADRFVVDGRLIVERGVTPVRIVPTLDEVEDRHPRLDLSLEATAVEQLALQGGKKTLAHRVIETIAYRPHRGTHASLTATHPKRDRGVLRTLVRVMNYRGGPALLERHVERGQHQFGAQMIFHRPAHHSAAEGV